MWAVYVHHFPSGPKTFVHKARVVAVHDTEVTVKWATDKKHTKVTASEVHHRGSQVLSECCKVGYSATLARVDVHRFICSENRGLPLLGDLCIEFIAEDQRYYPNVVK